MGVVIALEGQRPFAQGGNRLCYVHPERPDVCIKVPRTDVDLAAKRRRKGLKGRLKLARSFDDNRVDAQTLQDLHARFGPKLADHVPRFLGWVDTDLGAGVTVDLIRDAGGAIATPLKQFIWERGVETALNVAIDELTAFWIEYSVPSRELLLHNVVAQRRDDSALRLVVIDGLGNSDLLPFSRWSSSLARKKSIRKAARLRQRIDKLLQTKVDGGDPGQHGFLKAPGTS